MIRRALVLALAAFAASCGGTEPPPGPTPGILVASLNTPNDRDGALVIRIVGEHTGLTAATGYRLASSSGVQTATVRAIVSGPIVDGDLLQFHVPDIAKLATYTVVVEQAAARETYALLDSSGYNITLRVK